VLIKKIKGKLERIKIELKSFFSKIGVESSPDFIIIGAQKAGTTSLYNYITKYAENFLSPRQKELHYFDKQYHKSINWYKAQFPLNKKKGYITGEATPYYFFHPLSAQRICEHFPKTKLIVLLRNPIDRAYSHYQFEKNKGYEPLSFEKAIKSEEERIKNERKRIIMKDNYNSHSYQYFSYLNRGIYYDQLKDWFNYFSKDQFFILNSENLFSSPGQSLESIFDFVGLNFKEGIKLEFKKYNQNNYKSMDDSIRNYLQDFYATHNQKLYNLLNEDFDWN
jgi:hypothetical protein